MLESQFYTRLIINLIVGVMFAFALLKMAQYDNQESEPKKHLTMKIIGWLFIGLSVLMLIESIGLLTKLDFPPNVIGPFISPNMIVRPTTSTLYWGYPTLIQNSILSSAMSVFAFLGFGGYFLYFKSSKSKWWIKILKFLTVLFLYAFMASSTNLHYFDFPELVAPILFITLWFIIINRKPKQLQSSFSKIQKDKLDDTEYSQIQEKNQSKYSVDPYTSLLSNKITQPKEIESVIISPSADINQNIEEDEVKVQGVNPPLDSEPYKEEQNISNISNDNMQYCRFCGKKIESDSLFCKHCGKSLKNINAKRWYNIFSGKLKALLLTFTIWINNRRTKLLVQSGSSQNFEFSIRWKFLLVLLLVLLLVGFLGWFALLKYNRERWLGESYDAILVCSCIGLFFFPLIWYLGRKQERKRKRWRHCLLWFCLIISSLGALFSDLFFIDTLYSQRLNETKELYSYNKALESNDINILNNELNRRFESFFEEENASYDIAIKIKTDSIFFDKINEQARLENGVAQGILGEYYFLIASSEHAFDYFFKRFKRLTDKEYQKWRKENSDYLGKYSSLKTEEMLYNTQLFVSKYGRPLAKTLSYDERLDYMKTMSKQSLLDKSFYWWKKASENQDARGMYRMGNCYANIIKIEGISKDLNKAYLYWTKASEQGYGMAYKRLGDLSGTWDFLGGFTFDIPCGERTDSEVTVLGVDLSDTDVPPYSKTFPLPKEWKHDISIAREYWQKAVQCGGYAADEARKCLEKVYPEEKQ